MNKRPRLLPRERRMILRSSSFTDGRQQVLKVSLPSGRVLARCDTRWLSPSPTQPQFGHAHASPFRSYFPISVRDTLRPTLCQRQQLALLQKRGWRRFGAYCATAWHALHSSSSPSVPGCRPRRTGQTSSCWLLRALLRPAAGFSRATD